jgi:hypothetical protein
VVCSVPTEKTIAHSLFYDSSFSLDCRYAAADLSYLSSEPFASRNCQNQPEDVWFHVDDLSSAHVYLRLKPGQTMDDIPPAVLEDCGALVKANSIQGCKVRGVRDSWVLRTQQTCD